MAEKKEKRYVSDNAQLMAKWDWEKNVDFDPKTISCGSHKKVWWKCNKGHRWQAEVKYRVNGIGCPYCSGRYAIKGENDLQTVNPMLANEWHHEKNNELTPFDVMPNSRKKVWWKCSKGHEWQAMIYSRNNGSGCPICHSERNTSFPEYALIYYLSKCGFEALHSYKENGYELDVYVPSKRIAIEYDGYFWHKNKTTEDIEKNKKCQEDGIVLYRIREGLSSLNDSSIDYIIHKNQKDLPNTIELLFSIALGVEIEVDLVRDAIAIESLREHTEKESSILFSHPKIAGEWDYKRNGNLKPDYFTQSSHKKVWWKCTEGHRWQATIDNRTKGYGCPYCSGRSAIQGVNDIEAVNPILAQEWNYEKNIDLNPDSFKPNSGKNVWWKCSKGHEWQARIADRTNGRGCPYCAGKKILKGFNDLATTNPALCLEWNFEKNQEITPFTVTAGSSKKAWWTCSEGHIWQAMISNRTKGNGCPSCSGRKVLKGYNDLQTRNPLLSKEWNYEKNGNQKPEQFTVNSNERVWWICAKGHEWQTKINHRSNGSGCPECAKQRRKKKNS